MTKKTENARPTVGAVERAMESGRVCETVQPSTQKNTILAAERQPFRIADLLLRGQDNALPMRHLRELTGLDSRTIRRMIETERRNGALILSNNRDGYFMASDLAEVQRFTRSMLHRSREIAKTARILEGAAGLD